MCRGKGDPEGASVAGTVVRIFRGPVSAFFACTLITRRPSIWLTVYV
jgi:hypothetical protein